MREFRVFAGGKDKCYRDQEYERQRKYDAICRLEIDDYDAFCQLFDYCDDRRNMVDERVKKLLISDRLLAKDGSLPSATNEAMYELRFGERAPWI